VTVENMDSKKPKSATATSSLSQSTIESTFAPVTPGYTAFPSQGCLGASSVYISVCAVADDSPTSDETVSAAEGVCSIGILIYVLFVNVFTAVVGTLGRV